jgi:hypothetical protein
MPPVKPKSTPGRGQNPQTELEKQISKEQLAETSLLEEQSTTTAPGSEDGASAIASALPPTLWTTVSTPYGTSTIDATIDAAISSDSPGGQQATSVLAGVAAIIATLPSAVSTNICSAFPATVPRQLRGGDSDPFSQGKGPLQPVQFQQPARGYAPSHCMPVLSRVGLGTRRSTHPTTPPPSLPSI